MNNSMSVINAESKRPEIMSDSIDGYQLTKAEIEEFTSMNNEFAHVVIGARHRVMTYKPCPINKVRMTFEGINEFPKYFMHIPKLANKNLGDAWLKWPSKAFYPNGIGYYPDSTLLPKGTLNTFNGFGCSSVKGNVDIIEYHITQVLCGGDGEVANYFISWLAHIFQKPAQKPTVAVLMKSEQGSGKGRFYALLQKMLATNAHQVNGHYQLTGRFNSVIAGKLLIFGDEVDLTNKAVADKAKGIISEPTLSLELKGIDAEQIPNYARFIFAGNHERLISAGTRERRYVVLEPSSHKLDDEKYWQELTRFINGKGPSYFMQYLMDVDLSGFNPFKAPATKGLIEEKLCSLPNHLEFLYDELCKVSPFNGAVRLKAPELILNYKSWLDEKGESTSLAAMRSQIGKLMSQCGIQAIGRSDSKDGKFYELPDKIDFREGFSKVLGHKASEVFL